MEDLLSFRQTHDTVEVEAKLFEATEKPSNSVNSLRYKNTKPSNAKLLNNLKKYNYFN
jgi:hypothetical protein